MSRSRKFLGGLVLGYGSQAAMLVSGIWLTPLFLNHVGQHDYGLWLVGTQLLTYLTLTDFGVVALLPLETASTQLRLRRYASSCLQAHAMITASVSSPFMLAVLPVMSDSG